MSRIDLGDNVTRLKRWFTTATFGTRLLAALAFVMIGFAVSAWVVAAILAPGIFHEHLETAGLSQNSSEAAHMEEAFNSSMMLSWSIALAVSVVLSLAVSGYIARRVQRSISPVTRSVQQIAGGRYDSRVHEPGIGREFDDLVASFNELARRLDATETTRRRMLSDLAHELRTPLATLESHLEAIEDGVRALDDDTLRILCTATGRLGRLAHDVSAVSRAEEHLTRLIPIGTDTRSIIAAAIEALRPEYSHKNVMLQARIDQAVPITVDSDRINQVLTNLLHNALRHTDSGGMVTVTSRLHEGNVEITIADTGEGIAAQHLDHIFDRFYRVDTARDRAHGGSGIGLTITRALVEAHEGHIRVHSDGLGRGARFTISLPQTPAHSKG
ncbi:MAG: HAMP domain-containing protein [Rhodococcus sp.]|nr:HAMP domain-containing protein [Rhodococcus sp. (in: high G+C Gram-positive bacteria)]